MPLTTRPEDDVDPSTLVDLVRWFATETDGYRDAVGAHHGLHRTDLSALAVIIGAAQNGATITPRRLGDALHLSPPAVTALLDRLERAGHVERRRETGDRRLVHLVAMDAAIDTGRRVFGPLGAHVREVAERCTPQERVVIAAFLRAATDAVAAARDEATAS